MSYIEPIEPTVTVTHDHGDTQENLTHPAFGSIVITHPSSSKGQAMFGSSVPAPSTVRVEVHECSHKRSLSSDWYHPGNLIVEFEMTHAQWSQVVARPGRGEGTPITLTWRQGVGVIPGIKQIETRHETHQREIKEAAARRVGQAYDAVVKLSEAFEAGLGKREIRALIANARHSISALPGSVSFVVDQAHEALEASVAEAKIEVESFISAKVSQMGFSSLRSLGDAVDRFDRLSAEGQMQSIETEPKGDIQ